MSDPRIAAIRRYVGGARSVPGISGYGGVYHNEVEAAVDEAEAEVEALRATVSGHAQCERNMDAEADTLRRELAEARAALRFHAQQFHHADWRGEQTTQEERKASCSLCNALKETE